MCDVCCVFKSIEKTPLKVQKCTDMYGYCCFFDFCRRWHFIVIMISGIYIYIDQTIGFCNVYWF